MRVLLSGAFNPAFEALPEYLTSALRRLGHEVILFDHRRFLLPGRVRARCTPLERFDRRRLNARFLGRVRRSRPGLVLVNQGMVLSARTIEGARGLGARCVNWFSDYPLEFEQGLAVAPAYDRFFLGSSYAARRHAEAGHRRAFWLPFACDPEVHRPDSPREPAPPAASEVPAVVFVGSHYPERQILLRFLRGLPVGIWGPGWERAQDDPFIAPMIRGGALRPTAWRSIYARCRVALNIHYGAFGPVEVSGDLANTRAFEILACGAYQVSNRQADLLRLFREGEHLDAFSSGEELRQRVEEALRDEDRRGVIAAAGRAAVLDGHTYLDRARLLADPSAGGFAVRDTPAPARAPVASAARQ
jgi:spore maturation protein CgeB